MSLTEGVMPTAAVNQRLTHIDALRGLALFGVLAMNIGSMVMMFRGAAVFGAATLADLGVAAAELFLILGKARSSFAFLFGAGFAILLIRAQATGGNFRSYYLRRLGALAVFGLINQIFLFWGDILFTYAMLGFLLMLCAHWATATQLRVGLALAIVPPIVSGILMLLGAQIPDLLEPTAAQKAVYGLKAYTSPDYLDAIRANIWLGATRHATATAHMLVYDLSVFGMFLLGAWSVRTGLLTEPAKHRATLRRIAMWTLPIGFMLSAINMMPYLGFKPEGWAGALIESSFAGIPILAFGYLASLALLFSSPNSRAAAILAPAGRMALTNYLLSGAVGGWIFYGYGLGLIGEFGIVGTVILGASLFAVLTIFSHIWLSQFSMGPIEWLWRRISGARTASSAPLRESPTVR